MVEYRFMNRMAAIGLVFFALGSVAWAQAPDLSKMDIVQRSIPDGPVAKIRDTNITKEDFLMLYESELGRVRQQGLPDVARVQLALVVLRTLIEHELMYQEAGIRKIDVSDEEVDKALQSRLDGLRKGFSTQEGRELTEDETLEKIGFPDKADLRREVRRVLLIEGMRNKILEEDGLNVDDAKVSEIYEASKDRFVRPGTLHLKQIYVGIQDGSETSRQAARDKADRALAAIFSGQRFEAVAKQFSEAPDAANGGDMGPVPERELPPFMVAAVEGFQAGDVSDVVESDFGFHIMSFVSREAGSSISQEQAENVIRRQLAAEQETSAIYSYCDDLIANGAEVKVYLELEENLRRLGGAEPAK